MKYASCRSFGKIHEDVASSSSSIGSSVVRARASGETDARDRVDRVRRVRVFDPIRSDRRSFPEVTRRTAMTTTTTTLHPRIKWCEREDKVYLTIELPDAKNVRVDIDARTFEFSAEDASGRKYAETLRLYKPVKKDQSTYATTERQVFCALIKEDAEWWERLLASGEKKPANLHVDFDKWADEDDDAGDVDTSMFDMQSMMGGGGGGAPGMPGMGGGGGMPDFASMMGGMGGGMGGGAPGGGAPDMAKLQELIQKMKTEEAGNKPAATLEPVEEEGDDDDLPALE
jgi:HSP20 family molecular chaperone IbpA